MQTININKILNVTELLFKKSEVRRGGPLNKMQPNVHSCCICDLFLGKSAFMSFVH